MARSPEPVYSAQPEAAHSGMPPRTVQVQGKESSNVLVCAGVSSVLATSSCSSQTVATKDQ